MGNKLIIYELNELPRKLLEYYVDLKPNSNLNKLKTIGKDLNTFTTDKGELHPWTTWPTFYRGVDNSKHKITSLNQDINCEEKYPPVWKILLQNDVSIGIFGSLQSYPPLTNEKVKFYLPDTFAPDCKAFPKQLETFQKFNLKVVANNSGQVRSIRRVEIKYFYDCIVSSSIRLKSIIKIIIQIIMERLNNQFKSRRCLMQPNLSYDIFFRNLKKYKPNFSTFFTNHLAGMMHYYWLDVFPKDFENPYRKPCQFNKNSLIKALDIADEQIGLLMNFAQENSYELWVASSMGQEAIERKQFQRLFLRDFQKTIKFCKLNKKLYKQLPSMYPDINIESKTERDLDKLIEKFQQIKYPTNNESIFKIRYRKNAKKVNLIFQPTSVKSYFLIYKDYKVKLKDLGLEFGIDNQGTGYHSPNGVLLSHGKKSQEIFKDYKNIDTKNIHLMILDLFGIK